MHVLGWSINIAAYAPFHPLMLVTCKETTVMMTVAVILHAFLSCAVHGIRVHICIATSE